jgi:hypothetical protein
VFCKKKNLCALCAFFVYFVVKKKSFQRNQSDMNASYDKNKTKMNKIYLFLMALFLAVTVSGQESVKGQLTYFMRGYIYMKNGSVLKGKYIYSGAMDKIRVISGKNSWVFDANEVDRISKSKPRMTPALDSVFLFQEFTDSKWFNISEIGVMIGDPNDSQSAPAVFSSTIYRQVWKNIYAGAGIGMEFYKESYLPASLSVMYKLRNTRFTPIGVLKGGYDIAIGESRSLYYQVVPDYVYRSDMIWQGSWPQSQSKLDAKGGFFIEPSLGFIRQSVSGLGFTMSFGYRFHRLNYSGENDYRLFIDYNRFLIKLGFTIQ